MNILELKGKKVLILGYGQEGKACEKVINQLLPGTKVGIADISQGENYLDIQKNYDIVIKSPGINKSKVTIPYTTGTNLFFGSIDSDKIIGVTGTKGKSTTASLLYEILIEAGFIASLLGNIGKPMISELLKTPNKNKYYVCELSSYQLDDIEYSPHISVVVSLFPEHMNYHGSIDAYIQAKQHIISNAKADDYYVYNPKFQVLEEWKKNTKAKCLPYKTDLKIQVTKLQGEHNKDNIYAASTVAQILGISDEAISQVVSNFKPLKHRLEYIGTYRDITFYDDAISTTPESTVAALMAISGVKTILLGGQDRGYQFGLLVAELAKQKVENIVLFPESGYAIEKIIQLSEDYKPRIFHTKDMKEAVSFVFAVTPPGTVCLLSTASPSYSVWKNFEEKGDLFQKYVTELSTET